MGVYAEATDVAADYGPVPTEKLLRVDRLIQQAETLLAVADPHLFERVVEPDEQGQVPAGKVSKVLANQVVCEMVGAVLRNPDGVRSSTETNGPFTRSRTFLDSVAGTVELTDRHRVMLGLPPSPTSGRAFTIRPGGHPPPHHLHPRDHCGWWP